ncbi:MAG: hypothetical protein B7Y45_05655 [Sphingomonas sp. 28-66-16]|nr:MAG: hypothetical protein B7Y45_05655 [Sphingomonas sp. 28-66-16]
MRMVTRAALLAATVMSSGTAVAQNRPAEQTPPTTAAEAPAGQTGLEEIVVTARKVEESLQTAPVSVSVLSEAKIRTLGLNSIDDFAKQATGISFSQAFGRSSDRPVVRGASNVLANVQFGVESGAAYFVDGIYYQGDIQGFDPESLQRVEVIKGPQSALYGRNTYAGAINFITKDPTEKLTVSGRSSVAQYNEYTISASVSGQIIPGLLGFRIGGRHYEYGGQYINQLTGRKVGSERTESIYALLNFTPSDDLKIRLRGQYQHNRDGPLALFLQGAAANNCQPGFRSAQYRTVSSALPYIPNLLGPSTNNNQYFCGTIQPQPNGVRLNTDPIAITIPGYTGQPPSFRTAPITGVFDGTAFDGIQNDQYYGTAIIDWDIAGSGFVFSSLSGYRANNNLFGTDSDHSDSFFFFNTNPAIGGSAPNPLVTEAAFANTTRNDGYDFSQEVRIASPQRWPVRGLIGGYYFKQKTDGKDLSFANPIVGDPLGGPGSSRNELENMAVFGLLTVDITKRLSITGEVRYAEETRKSLDFSSAPIFCAGYAGQTNVFGTFTAANCRPENKDTGTTPRVTINYSTPGGLLFYGIYAQGRKPSGFNGTAGVTATTQTGQNFVNYLAEKSEGFELGTKFGLLNNRVRVSASVYTTKLTDVQLTTAIPNPNGTGAITSIVTNQGNARTTGFELEVQAAPTDRLNLGFGVSYVDARFTSGCDADQFILNSGGIRPNFDNRNPTAAGLPLCDITGKRLPLGSPVTLNGNATYTVPLHGNLSLWSNLNFSYESSKYVQVDNLAQVGDAFLLNGRIGVRSGQFSLAAFVRNLTDEDSAPLATRWFDYRYGAGTTGLPAAATVTFDGRPAQIETGAPRAFFTALRKGRTFGIEGTFNF